MPLLLVAYDIANDRRRARLHDRLMAFGNAVQESVFECELDDEADIVDLRAMIRATTRRTDNVRIYHLCERCRDQSTDHRGRQLADPPDIFLG